jgi:hypothetical protein
MTANTFLALGDTPSSYIGERLKFLRVDNTESGVTFTNVELNDLVDVEADNAYTPQTGQGLVYSESAGVWRPTSLDVYSAGNGISKSALTINVLAGLDGGITANTQGVFISPIANVAGTYGSDLLIPVVTINNKGQVTNVTTRTANVQTAYNLAADYVGNINGTLGQITVTGGRGNNSNAAINLVATGVTAGTYGNSTTIPRITVDSYGRIQDIDSVTVTGGSGSGNGTILGFANIVVAGQTTVSADRVEDSVTFVAGAGTTITTSANADTITFGVNATDVANNISIADLTDVGSLDGIVNGQSLIWNNINQRFQIGFAGNGGGTATVISSETAPVGPLDATLWYDQVSGRLYIYYDGFWVDAAPASSFNANISSPTSGQVLKYNGTEWVNQNDTDSSPGDIEGVTAGNGLTGGGSSGSVTLNIGAGAGITVNADNVALASGVVTTGAKTYGSATLIPQITVDTYGRVTSVSNVSVSGGYTPADPDNWDSPTVSTVAAALDELAARLTAIQNYEIDGGNAYTPAEAELLIDGNNGA